MRSAPAGGIPGWKRQRSIGCAGISKAWAAQKNPPNAAGDEHGLGGAQSGVSLLTGCIGPAKPVAFIEDAAVRPEQLPDYVAGLQSIMKLLGLEASYYGHAATGLLHVRPVVDLHSPGDLSKFRKVADETSKLVRQFKGSLSAEHGVGIARTEYMEEQLGAELLGLMKAIKNTFDPKDAFNPGKILADGRHRIDMNLRDTFSRPIELPFKSRLAFAFKDRSFIGNLEQCNGCGGCRKDAPMMCPTFVATGDEVMSTRGRANIIRAALQLRLGRDPLRSDELEIALSNCLSCKGCTPECPSNVNLALLKAELTYARHRRDGLPLRERILSNVDVWRNSDARFPALQTPCSRWARCDFFWIAWPDSPRDEPCRTTRAKDLIDGSRNDVSEPESTTPAPGPPVPATGAKCSCGTTRSFGITSRTLEKPR